MKTKPQLKGTEMEKNILERLADELHESDEIFIAGTGYNITEIHKNDSADFVITFTTRKRNSENTLVASLTVPATFPFILARKSKFDR